MTFAQGQRAIVVDASVAVSLLGGNEAWLERWQGWTDADAMVLVPPHFPAEVANALLRSVRISAEKVAARISELAEAGIEMTDRGWPGVLGAVELADRHRLSVYDALYLDLALDVEAELATLDRNLAKAARSEGLAVTS